MVRIGVIGAIALAVGCGDKRSEDSGSTTSVGTPAGTAPGTTLGTGTTAGTTTPTGTGTATATGTGTGTGTGSPPPVGAVQYGGGVIKELIHTSDGGVAFVGFGDTFSANNVDLFAVKLTPDNQLEWQVILGGSGTDQGWAIEEVAGGYLVAGSTTSYGQGAEDAWVLHLDTGGNVVWEKAYGHAGTDRAREIVDTGTSWIVVAESSQYASGYDIQPSILRIDGSGNLVEARIYDSLMGWPVSVSGASELNGGAFAVLAVSPDCYSCSHASGWVLFFDAGGTFSWSKRYSVGSVSYFTDLIDLGGSEYLGVGQVRYAYGYPAVPWMAKMDGSVANGALLWQYAYPPSTNEDGLPLSIIPQTGGNYVVSGRTYHGGYGASAHWLAQFDGNGVLNWTNEYGLGNDGDPHVVERTGGMLTTSNAGWFAEVHTVDAAGAPTAPCGTTGFALGAATAVSATPVLHDPWVSNLALTTVDTVSTSTYAFGEYPICP